MRWMRNPAGSEMPPHTPSCDTVRMRRPSGGKHHVRDGAQCGPARWRAACHRRPTAAPFRQQTRSGCAGRRRKTPRCRTVPVWPCKVARGLPSPSHSRAVLSSDAVRMRWPSGENTALPNGASVALQGGERLAVAVPQPRRVVIGCGQDALAVGGKHCAPNSASVALQGGERLAVAVPQPRRFVAGRGQDAPAVGENTALRTS